MAVGRAEPTRPGRREEAGVPPALRGLVSRLLRGGLLIAAFLFVLALVRYLQAGVGLGSASVAEGPPGDFGSSLAAGDPAALALLGLAVLLVTPLVRVAVSVGLFAHAGDRAFTALTLFVLVLLAVTIGVGVFR